MTVMTKENVQEKIRQVISGSKLANLATVWNNKPWTRYVQTKHLDDGTLNLYCSTSVKSRKVSQIKSNNNIHLTMSERSNDPMSPYVQFSGHAEVLTDPETKHKLWQEDWNVYFKGPDDPDYCILKFVPHEIELMGAGENPWVPFVWKA